MLRLVNLVSQSATSVTFSTEEILDKDALVYVMYDTSTGVYGMNDYYSWRTVTTSTGDEDVFNITIDNTTIYPGTESALASYTVFNPRLFKIMTWVEHEVIQMLITRVDLIRKRFPNPGVTISSSDYIGENGVVSFAGGWDKKFSLEELRQMVEGSLLEINWQPPATTYWWQFSNTDTDKQMNPYYRTFCGIPYDLVDLIVRGAVIRCLDAWGILEIDINFSTSDAGLVLTYDRVGHIASWMQSLIAKYNADKMSAKWNYANHAGIGVGSYPFAAMGWVGFAMNQVSQTGVTPLSSMLGFGIRGNVPM
jgi:hypothetical protein